ncbi:sigma-54-dependent transcriptional regulator [Desulfurivibrio alkaliphilus]|uniref:Two component, sigma54 specific, transcriptional regulator, Fis family n=1 Tax=Desulfurivibrio alkaliphilus (strain DSM 19089 / UNIQEM U267 / AHT2) TaxID=589865 RepID=D6Z286_DESAT|nr:sigma-54 dependent transcriptional regulator [Desulfurivibrio alkaliphilus]ADH85661.1 two component, sigma54 specific, transcriptional regulator, Fis family [Desulfurivibrio alkaliphilus AHT 2]
MKRILVVDDELSMREFLKILLEEEGYAVSCADGGTAALELLAREDYDLLISDIRMPPPNGLELLVRAKEIKPELPVVLVTAFASPDDAVSAMKSGAYDYITKPFKVDEIKDIVGTALSSPQPLPAKPGESEVAATNEFEGIIGGSPEMRKIYDIISRVAPTRANVLIQGESGTGKELVARAIHRLSPASGHEFVPIVCSAIPESLFESEVFGHTKGAFTGAASSRAGLFEQANQGTAFLDEIGELTPIIQTKLLRVLQEREIKRVGATESTRIQIRVISATNKDLEEEVMAGRFREDLFYRLAVVPIRVPPLRERKGDVPLLVDHFLAKYARLFNKDIHRISSYAMEVLLDYDFPGNVRELENIIERGVAMENSQIILPESLTLSGHRRSREPEPAGGTVDDKRQEIAEEVFSRGLEPTLADLEREMIVNALEKAGNSKTRAAELLRTSFRSLRYKIKKYGIDNGRS